MGMTIGANTKTNAHKGSGGAIASFPDVCKQPGSLAPFVPVPMGLPGSSGTVDSDPPGGGKIVVKKKNALTMTSSISHSSGDEAGTLKEVVSFNTGGPTFVKSGNVVVMGSTRPVAVGETLAAMTSDSPRLLRDRLNQLHGQMITLPGIDPNRWHALLDEYVQAMAQLYVALAPR